MSLVQKIKADQLVARKSRATVVASLLTTLLGDIQTISKNDGDREPSDAEVVALIKKYIKNMTDTITKLSDDAVIRSIVVERDVLTAYLPKQLSKDELLLAIIGIAEEQDVHTLRQMGVVMKVLKERYDGQYDGVVASALIKTVLT